MNNLTASPRRVLIEQWKSQRHKGHKSRIRGRPYYMVCTAPSTYFWNLVFYSFSAIPKHVISFHAQSTISANGLGCLLQIRGAQCVFPICFCVNVACIHPLGFRSNGNLFPTLAQPCVSGFTPRPDGIIPMLKPCAPKKLVSYMMAFPVVG